MSSDRFAERDAQARESQFQGIGQVGLGDDTLQVKAQVNDGLGDLRAHTTDNAISAHQADGGDGFE
ncbi:hypothetical protein D3C76_1766760 [compost metagenome]